MGTAADTAGAPPPPLTAPTAGPAGVLRALARKLDTLRAAAASSASSAPHRPGSVEAAHQDGQLAGIDQVRQLIAEQTTQAAAAAGPPPRDFPPLRTAAYANPVAGWIRVVDATGAGMGVVEQLGVVAQDDRPALVAVLVRGDDGTRLVAETPLAGFVAAVRAVYAGAADQPEVADAERQRRNLTGLAVVLSDLDRCRHGRHEGDACAGWRPGEPDSGCEGGRSRGNPHMPTGAQVGHDLYGRPIVVPDRGSRHHPDAWRGDAPT